PAPTPLAPPARSACRSLAPKADRLEQRAWRIPQTSFDPFLRHRLSRDDLQRGDLVAFQSEEVPNVHGAAGKVAGELAGDDELAVLLLGGNWLARVLVLGRGFYFPLHDGSLALVGVPLVLHDCVVREALSQSFALALVGGEVHSNGFW